MVAAGPRLFFAADDGTGGMVLWAYGPPPPPVPTEPEPTLPSGPNHSPTLTGQVSLYGSISHEVCFTPVDPDGDDVSWHLTFEDGGPRPSYRGRLHSGRQHCEVYGNPCEGWVTARITANDGRGGGAEPLALQFYLF
jgi:hypothetical protein